MGRCLMFNLSVLEHLTQTLSTFTHFQYKCKFSMGNFWKIKMLRLFSKYFFVGQLDDGSETEILWHNYWQALRGASLSMHILTRIYELCNVRDCNHPHTKLIAELLLTSREWALLQIVKYLSFDTFVTIAVKYTNSSSHSEWRQYLRYLAHSNYMDCDFNAFFSKLMES